MREELMRLLDPCEHDDWDAFVDSAPDGTLFHTAWWHRAWGLTPRVYARTGKGGRIEAGLPLCVVGRGRSHAVVRPPLSPVSGPVSLRPAEGNRAVRNVRIRREMAAALACIPDVAYCELTLGPGSVDAIPFLWGGFSARPVYTYVIAAAEADIWESNVHPRHLRRLARAHREAEAGGLVLDEAPPMSVVHPLLVDTARRDRFSLYAGIPAWWERILARGAGRAYLLRGSGGEPLCATVMVWDRRSAYYLLGGMREDVRRTDLNFLLIERMVRDALDRGLGFDFEGSLLAGVERFFRLWGGELRVLLRLVRARDGAVCWEDPHPLEPSTLADGLSGPGAHPT